ncbi:MAG: hypothetical protein Q7T63_01135 [Burkholderiaceae bacterium]|nr:hypothetical protein [Burkholderiaceae bacterium]
MAASWRSPGADGRTPAPPHDETGHTWHHDAAPLIDISPEAVRPSWTNAAD